MTESDLEKWSRLYTQAKLSEAQIKANPMPHLIKMSRQVSELREAVEEAIVLLSGSDDLDIAQDVTPDAPPNATVAALRRNCEAYAELRQAIQDMNKEG